MYLNLLALTSCLIGTNEHSLAKCICVGGVSLMERNIGATPLQLPRAAGQPEEHAFHHMTTWAGATVKRREPKRLATSSPAQEDVTILAPGY